MSFHGRAVNREVRREMERENAKMPAALIYRPREEWPSPDKWPKGLVEVWQSREFLVQLYEAKDDAQRMTVCRATLNAAGTRWEAGITWGELQRLKRECGRGHLWAVELFPADADVVDVANMRHLWILGAAPAFAWRTQNEEFLTHKEGQ